MKIVSEIKSFFTKFFGSEPKWEKIASAALTVAAPLVQTTIALTAGEPAAAAAGAIIEKIQYGMATANALVVTSGSSPTLSSVLASIITNLKELETAAQVKDPATQQKLTETVTLLVGEIQSVIELIPGATPPAPAAA